MRVVTSELKERYKFASQKSDLSTSNSSEVSLQPSNSEIKALHTRLKDLPRLSCAIRQLVAFPFLHGCDRPISKRLWFLNEENFHRRISIDSYCWWKTSEIMTSPEIPSTLTFKETMNKHLDSWNLGPCAELCSPLGDAKHLIGPLLLVSWFVRNKVLRGSASSVPLSTKLHTNGAPPPAGTVGGVCQ